MRNEENCKKRRKTRYNKKGKIVQENTFAFHVRNNEEIKPY